MSEPNLSLANLQTDAVRFLSKATIAASVAIALFVWAEGGHLAIALGGGALFSALAFLSTRLANQRLARITVSQALVGTAITMNAALIGNAMQLDSHMFYFAVLAMIVMTNGLRALLIAAATIAVHHVVLTLVFPHLVYPSQDLMLNIQRSVFHAVIVVIETGVLAYMIIRRTQTDAALAAAHAQAQDAIAQAQNALADAQAQRSAAEAALQEAERARMTSEQAHQATEAAHEQARVTEEEKRATEAAANQARSEREAQLQRLVSVFRHHLAQLATGDVSSRISQDLGPDYRDLRDSYNEACARLETALSEVQSQTETIQNQSREISSSANDLSGRTERQAATLAQIAASLDQLTRTIQSVARDSNDAQTLAETTSSDANEGTEIMTRAVRAMQEIESSSMEIQKITGVIDDIAFQTNLLALNAGVEAARAGEAGRGFAVVASEVRALAQRSSDAAREINGLINSSVTQVANGAKVVNQTGDALTGIQASVDKITSRLRSIAESTSDQSQGISEVNDAISKLEAVTQQNAAMFEETTAANGLLFKGTAELADLVATFNTSGVPSAGAPPSDFARPRLAS
ncbi:Methyl-accepting chemotaxis protein II [Aquimixticola soesokkakensis]|uniref:Methyl-accepting chemotaxis protein II n=1 Tax=Aquimixticola soesokkakensis TaxID=1519096 RepID=A0A1Y5T122_9RHOB|nr:methyl-accepting chemotaxis protein [Aquimixticola soesokkakensis]SLN49614.1 Methyl-accepting chemotaxis protein II [Aquimixticola soesokkakensis]